MKSEKEAIEVTIYSKNKMLVRYSYLIEHLKDRVVNKGEKVTMDDWDKETRKKFSSLMSTPPPSFPQGMKDVFKEELKEGGFGTENEIDNILNSISNKKKVMFSPEEMEQFGKGFSLIIEETKPKGAVRITENTKFKGINITIQSKEDEEAENKLINKEIESLQVREKVRLFLLKAKGIESFRDKCAKQLKCKISDIPEKLFQLLDKDEGDLSKEEIKLVGELFALLERNT